MWPFTHQAPVEWIHAVRKSAAHNKEIEVDTITLVEHPASLMVNGNQVGSRGRRRHTHHSVDGAGGWEITLQVIEEWSTENLKYNQYERNTAADEAIAKKDLIDGECGTHGHYLSMLQRGQVAQCFRWYGDTCAGSTCNRNAHRYEGIHLLLNRYWG